MKAAIAPFLLAAAASVSAQPECPHSSEVGQKELIGTWRADFDGKGHVGTLLLHKHPEYAETVSGLIDRNGELRKLAGDVDDGDFTLEESADGVHIAATWLGEIVEGSCGREIRGTWTAEGDQTAHVFVLRKE